MSKFGNGLREWEKNRKKEKETGIGKQVKLMGIGKWLNEKQVNKANGNGQTEMDKWKWTNRNGKYLNGKQEFN